MSNELPLLVAPRPVRLTGSHHPFFRPNQLKFVSPDPPPRAVSVSPPQDELQRLALFPDDSPSPSPRSSEALEEFLSILRPSFFPPSSLRRSSRPPQSFQYERPSHTSLRIQHTDSPPITPSPVELDTIPDSPVTQSSDPDSDTPYPAPLRWFSSGMLSSPISRMHTRNPFFRHATTDSSTPISPLSPAAIPLPLQTSDEIKLLQIS